MKDYNLNEIFDLSGNNNELKKVAKTQQEGIKMALNILENRRYVLIADDVGMGKTYEGLGILFYKMFENNKEGKGMNALIVAPNNEVAEKWNTEIKSFKTNCLKNDIKIEIEDNNYYLRKIINNKQIELRKKKKVEYDKNYLTIINLKNFSSIKFNEDNDIEATVNKLKDESKELPDYDLVIIDESQNLRRHESNKSRCFSALFQLNNKINSSRNPNLTVSDKFKKVVLLSATPNHSSKNDITSQVQYFETANIANSIKTQIITDIKNFDRDIKDEEKLFIIKRYREYDGKKKYEFRQFEAYNTENMKFIEMLTMALIQKNQIKDKNGVFKMGYLDGFESFISSQNKEDDDNSDYYLKEHWNLSEDNKTKEKYYIDNLYNEIKDYTEKKHLDIHNILTHPKPRCIQELLLNFNELSYLIQKCLIFVRRVSSIEEIEKLLIKNYDNELTKLVSEATNSKINSLKDLIIRIDKKLKKDNTFEYQNNDLNSDNKKIQEENEFEDDENNEIIKSEWLKQLELKKVSKVKLKFHTGEDYNYYDFFEPKILNSLFKVNEIKEIYSKNQEEINKYILSYQANLKKGKMRNYHKLRAFTAGFLEFQVQLAQRENDNDKKKKLENILNEYISIMKLKKSDKKIEVQITNLYEFYSSFLNQKNFWDCKEFEENDSLSFINKSNKGFDFELFKRQIRIKKIIEKNLLNSEGMIYLLTVLSQIEKKYIYQIKTNDIINFLEKDKSIFHKRIMNRIKEFIINYNKEEKIIQNLNIEKCYFKSPIAGTSGKIGSSKRVIIQSLFNTSFYPDIIISTDIFNEGIDLHLFCSRIIHYGIAWLPGDMEQRIGRIDRLFCKGYRDYEESKDNEGNGNCKQIKIDFIHMNDEMDKRQISKILGRMIEAIKELEVLDSGEKNKEVDCNEERDEIKEKIDILNKIGESL